MVLARHLGCTPDEVPLANGFLGKPEFAGGGHERPVEFSVSRCDDRCLIAVSRTGLVGVDLERRRTIGDLDRIASLYFTPHEAGTIAALRDGRKLDAFFDCWTSKEAYVKALGTGLTTPLESFALPTAPSNATGVTWATVHGRDWTLYRCHPWPGYTAAVVLAGHHPHATFHLEEGHVEHDH
jgi:4'-phosphopantetheinyl transferase